MQSKTHIHVVSQSIASIGEVTNDIVSFLQNCSNYVITEEFKGQQPKKYETLLCHYFTSKIVKHKNFQLFRHKILIFPVDGTAFVEGVVDNMNQFDLIITPGTAGKKILEKVGVTTEIKVIPNFYHINHVTIDPDVSISKSLKKELKDSYVFYYEANFYERKGFEELMSSFIHAFSTDDKENKENVTLLIKTDNSLKSYEYFERIKKESILKTQKLFKFPVKIVKVSQHIKFEQLKKIWNRIDCYVHPARIEGFGIPLLRMAVLGKPILVLENSFSGYNDFLKNYPFVCYTASFSQHASKESNLIYNKKTNIWKRALRKSFINDLRKMYNSYPKSFSQTYPYEIEMATVASKLRKYEHCNVMTQYMNVFDKLPTQDKFTPASFSKSENTNVSIKGIKYICARGTSGYAQAAKDYIVGLHKAGIPVTVQFIEEIYDKTNTENGERNLIVNKLVDNDIEYNKIIIHSTPELWERYVNYNKKGVEVIGMTVWEADSLDPRWPNWINKVDKLIVPCTWNIEVFRNSGVTIPIEAIPHIYKPLEKTKKTIEEVKKTYTFYTIGQWTERKGIGDLIVSFLNAYTKDDNVSLLIKTFGLGHSLEESQKIKTAINTIADKYISPAKIVLISGECTEEEISSIHNSGDCFISLCKSEGWGLGAFDAVGFGNPVIITGYGGQLDFIQQPTVNFKLGSVKNMGWCTWHNEEQKWAYPNLDHAQELMVSMTEKFFKNNVLLRNSIKSQTNNVRKNYTYKKITNKLLNFSTLKISEKN
jgi:glycosyltransferase involved in cell wall biosynthesis